MPDAPPSPRSSIQPPEFSAGDDPGAPAEDLWRLVRYAVVGVSVAAVYAGLFLGLHQLLGLREWLASVFAYGIAVAFQYIAQTVWTFRRPLSSRSQGVRFGATIVLGATYSTVLTGFVGPLLQVPDALTVAVVVCSVPVVNYLAFRFWVYPDGEG